MYPLPPDNGRMSSGTQFPAGDSPSAQLNERKRATTQTRLAPSDSGLTAVSLPPSVTDDSKEEQAVTWGKTPDGTGGPPGSPPHPIHRAILTG